MYSNQAAALNCLNYGPQGRISDAAAVQMLRSAAAAGFNIFRIWGGGIYQSEAFYDAADELGCVIFA